MFNKETYVKRRAELKKLVGKGIIILLATTSRLQTFLRMDIILSVRTHHSSIISVKNVTD